MTISGINLSRNDDIHAENRILSEVILLGQSVRDMHL